MKKERKLKLIVNKIRISNLNTLYGGTNVASAILCATDDPNLVCDDPTSGTGATKTIINVRHCIAQSDGC